MRRLSEAVTSASAVGFGLLTWVIAHVLTYLLFAHIHDGPVPIVHMHGGVGPVLVAAAGLLATCALGGAAVGCVLRRSRGSHRLDAIRPGSMNAALAPAVFVLVELAQHLASGDEGPPATLLVVGVVLHTTMGAATPLLWTGFIAPATRIVLAGGMASRSAERRSRPATGPDATWTDRWPSMRLHTRGPPRMARCSPVLGPA